MKWRLKKVCPRSWAAPNGWSSLALAAGSSRMEVEVTLVCLSTSLHSFLHEAPVFLPVSVLVLADFSSHRVLSPPGRDDRYLGVSRGFSVGAVGSKGDVCFSDSPP